LPIVDIFAKPQQGQSAQMDLSQMLGSMFTKPPTRKRQKVSEALRLLIKEESQKLLDMDRIVEVALDRVQHHGIIFLDEIDKIAMGPNEGGRGPDVSREGVQRDLLPIVEGSTVRTKYGVIKTDHILFIAAGAFHVSKPSDLIPELQGRFPIRVELDSLTQDDFARILTEPKNSLRRQYVELLGTEGLDVRFEDSAVAMIAQMAWRANEAMENIGARRLYTIMEVVFEELSFNAPEMNAREPIVITAQEVQRRLEGILQDDDLSRYIL
jgi:ATP-dependent HslUV protease ATP-binding subunit HslU